MSREGRSQPVQPFAVHGFLDNTPANGVLPPVTVVVVENPDDRRRKPPPPPPVVLSAALSSQTGAALAPPQAILVENETRQAQWTRRHPELPLVTRGFLGNIPANGVLPQPLTVVPLIDERRRLLPPLPPVITSGATQEPPPPPPAVNVDRPEQRERYHRQDPVVLSAALTSQPGAATLTPPLAVNVDRPEQRARYRALNPVVLLGPPDDPAPGPVNVDRPERRALRPPDPVVIQGPPPPPEVVAPPAPVSLDRLERRTLRPLDPISIQGPALPPDAVAPPPPVVTPLSPPRPQPPVVITVTAGFVDPGPAPVGVTPPPVFTLDRVDQRVRLLPLPPLIISGARAPVPPPLITVLAGTDWASEQATW